MKNSNIFLKTSLAETSLLAKLLIIFLLTSVASLQASAQKKRGPDIVENPYSLVEQSVVNTERCYEWNNAKAKRKKTSSKIMSEKAQKLLATVLKIADGLQQAESDENDADKNIKLLTSINEQLTANLSLAPTNPKETPAAYRKRISKQRADNLSTIRSLKKKRDRAIETYKTLLPTGIPALDAMRNKSDSLKSFDRAMMWNYYAYFGGLTEDFALSKRALASLLEEEGATISLKKHSLWQLGILQLQDEEFEEGYTTLLEWQSVAQGLGDLFRPDMYFLLSRAALQSEKKDAALQYLLSVFGLSSCYGNLPKENWLTMLFDLSIQQGNVDKAVRPLELLIMLYPKKRYWIRLQSVLAQLERSVDQTAVLEIAWRQGFFDKEREYKALGTSLLSRNLPYQATKILEEGIEKGIVKEDSSNLKILSSAYRRANEWEKAIATYLKRDKYEDSGDNFIEAAGLYLLLGDSQKALDNFDKAVKKGNLKKEYYARLQLGISHYQVGKLDEAIEIFTALKKDQDNNTRRERKASVEPWIDATMKRQAYLARHNDRLDKFQEELEKLAKENPGVELSAFSSTN